MNLDLVAELLKPYDEGVKVLARALVERIANWVPDAEQELDLSAHLIAFTYIPGTYRGLFVAVAPQQSYVNLMFSRGVELQEFDVAALLHGTGKKARHITVADPERLADPAMQALVEEAARRAPRR